MSDKDFNNELLRLAPNLERYAYSLARRSDDANDLVQETYLKALSNKERFQADTNFKAWLFTIMKNTFINNYRRQVRQRVSSSEEQSFVLTNKPSGTDVESGVYSTEINSMITKLSDPFRIPFTMYNDGYKYQEIADQLGLKIGTVKSRIFFSRQKLMQAMDGYSA